MKWKMHKCINCIKSLLAYCTSNRMLPPSGCLICVVVTSCLSMIAEMSLIAGVWIEYKPAAIWTKYNCSLTELFHNGEENSEAGPSIWWIMPAWPLQVIDGSICTLGAKKHMLQEIKAAKRWRIGSQSFFWQPNSKKLALMTLTLKIENRSRKQTLIHYNYSM